MKNNLKYGVWQEVDAETYDREQKNPASLGGSSDEVHTALNDFLAQYSRDNKRLGAKFLPFEFSSILEVGLLANTLTFSDYDGNLAIAKMNKIIEKASGDYQTSGKSMNYNTKDALSFGTMLHAVLLEDALETYKIVEDNEVDTINEALNKGVITTTLYNIFTDALKQFAEFLAFKVLDKCPEALIYKEKGFVKYYPTLCLSEYPNLSYTPTFRWKSDCIIFTNDTLYIIDVKTCKDTSDMSKTTYKYALQLMFYFLCLLDQKEFLSENLKRFPNITTVKGIILPYDKSETRFTAIHTFTFADEGLNTFRNIADSHDLMVMFNNFSEDLIKKT